MCMCFSYEGNTVFHIFLFERIESHICQMKLLPKLSKMIFIFFCRNQIL